MNFDFSTVDYSSPIVILFIVVAVSFIILFFAGWWKIFVKAGYSGFWTVLMIVPLVNIVIFLKIAFEDWPIFQYFEEQLKYALARQHYTVPDDEVLNHDLLFPHYRTASKATSENNSKAN